MVKSDQTVYSNQQGFGMEVTCRKWLGRKKEVLLSTSFFLENDLKLKFQIIFKFKCFAILGNVGATISNITTGSLSLVVFVVTIL